MKNKYHSNLIEKIRYFVSVIILLFAVQITGCDVNSSKNTKPAKLKSSKTVKQQILKPLAASFKKQQIEIEESIDRGDIANARRLIKHSLVAVEKAGRDYDDEKIIFLLFKGIILMRNGNSNEARRFLGDAMAISRVNKNDEGAFRVSLALAELEEGIGDIAAAKRHLDEAGEKQATITNKKILGEYLIRQGNLMVAEMKYKEAAEIFKKAITLFKNTKMMLFLADTYMKLAFCQDGAGDLRQSKNSLNSALKIFQESKNKQGEVKAMHKLASIAVENKNYKTAKKLFSKVESLYSQLGRQSDASKVRQRMAALPE